MVELGVQVLLAQAGKACTPTFHSTGQAYWLL